MSERRRRSDRHIRLREDASKQEPLWHEMQPEEETIVPANSSSKDEISHVIVVGGHARTKAGSAVGRGMVGSAVLGPVGLLFGLSAKKKEYVTLLVHYKSGKNETVRVKVGSVLFNVYAPYITS